MKRLSKTNMISNKTGRVLFILAALIGFVGALAGNVLAAEEVQAAVQAASGQLREFGLAIGAGLGLGLAAAGGALAQGRAVSSAMEGLSRNPQASDKMFLPLILGLVFIESLVIYTLVIAFFLQGKI
ncbi:MAG: ATP synthase F0 subunit C [Candidatus Calescibacterium sp.]